MRNLILFLILISSLAFGASFNDSVLVGGTGPANSKAQLEVKSTTKGVLLPRGTNTQMNAISSPPEGLLFYNNSTHELSIYDGITWQAMFDAGNLTGTLPAGSVPAPTASTLGGVFSKSVVSHQFLTGIGTGTGSPSSAQPAFTDLTGTCTVAQGCVALTSATLGDLIYGSATNTWSNLVGNITSTKKFLSQTGTGSVSAAPTWIQPACGDLSNAASSCSVDATNAANIGTGTLSPARMPNPTSSSLGGVQSAASVLHQWINSISTSGVPALSQPAFSDISGSVATSQMPALTGDVTSSAGAVATTVVKIQGVSVATTSPTSGQVLTYNNLTSKWDPENSGLNGVLTVSSGGTGNSSLTNHGMLVGAGTTSITVVPPDASTTKVWTSGGASADPSWQPPAGGLIGPGSSTDTAIALWNGTAGTTVKNSTVLVDTSGNISTSGDTTSVKIASATDPTSVLSMAYNQTNTRAEIQTLQTSTNTGRGLFIGTADVGGANANSTGSVTIGTGSKTAGTGNSAGLTLTTGTTVGGTRGRIAFADGSEVNSPGAVWTISGNAGGGHWVNPSDSKNYIANPDANIQSSSTTPAGWANYADAAGTSPVDCTGGSPVTALTRNTSSPIGPTTDFRWTKSAANRQGEGFSYDFSIDQTDQAKVVKVAFDYSVISGTFVPGSTGVDSDMTVWIYDITNGGAPIQPSTYKLFSSATSPPAGFDTTFQSNSNSTSYRLCVHTGTTSASAYTLAFRNFEVKRAKYTYGSPITDWQSYTPTITGFGTPTGVNFFSRKVGDTLQVHGFFSSGTSTATAAAITVGYAGANANVTIDTSKINGGTYIGHAVSGKTPATTLFSFELLGPSSNGTSISFGSQTSTTSGAASGVVGTSIAASGNSVEVDFQVPIVGWSSTVQMSDGAPQSLNSFYGTFSQTVNNTTPTLTLTSSWDTVGAVSSSTFTARVPGKYDISVLARSASVAWTVTNAIELYYSKNGGGTVIIGRTNPATGTYTAQALGVDHVDLKAGDTLVFKAYSDVSNTMTGNVWVQLASSPQTIGATETVAARYMGSSSTPGTTGVANAITFTTKDYDTFSMCTGGATCTLPVQGKYRVNACLYQTAATTAASQGVVISISKNGTLTSFNESWFTSATAKPISNCVTDTVSGITGDTITFKAGNDGTTPSISASNLANYFTIERIGN